MLLTNSYLQGLTDAMPSIEDFREFMAPALRGEGGRVVNLHLDSGEPGALPSTETGWLSLVLVLAACFGLEKVISPVLDEWIDAIPDCKLKYAVETGVGLVCFQPVFKAGELIRPRLRLDGCVPVLPTREVHRVDPGSAAGIFRQD